MADARLNISGDLQDLESFRISLMHNAKVDTKTKTSF